MGRGRHLITDYRCGEQVRDECPDFDVMQRDRPTMTLGQSIDKVLRRHGLKKVGVCIGDDVVTTADGCDIITHSPRELIAIE